MCTLGERNGKIMNPYEKLDHEKRTWDLKETAAFLGYSPKYFYSLVRQGKLDGCWLKLKGEYRFCPAKIKEWMERTFNSNGNSPKPDHSAKQSAGGEHHGEDPDQPKQQSVEKVKPTDL
jgi:predicted DNA-binding transcriptional regulator AlpA